MLKNWAMYRMMCVVAAVFTSHCILNIFNDDEQKLNGISKLMIANCPQPSAQLHSTKYLLLISELLHNKMWNLLRNVTYSQDDDDVLQYLYDYIRRERISDFPLELSFFLEKCFRAFCPRPISSSLTWIFTVYTYDI